MDTLDLIKKRVSIREYDFRPVEQEKLDKVLESIRLAPSGRNTQLWKYIVVKDEKKIKKLGEITNRPAPIYIVGCGLDSEMMMCGQPYDAVNVSIAMSFVMLEATELGLGTCWLAGFEQEPVKKLLGIPKDVSIVAITPLGYPAEHPEPKPRKSVDEIVSYDSF